MKGFYADDFDTHRLVLRGSMFLDIARIKNVKLNNMEDIVSFIMSHCEATKDMII